VGKNILQLSLDHPKVQRRKMRFEQNRRNCGRNVRCVLTFEQLYERFNGRHTQRAVARAGQISRSAVRRLYESYFSDICPPPEQKSETLSKDYWSYVGKRRKLDRKLEISQQEPKDPFLLAVWKKLRDLKFPTSLRVKRDDRGTRVCKRLLMVNGWQCGIYDLTPYRRKKPTRLCVQLRVTQDKLRANKFLILRAQPYERAEYWFVIPTASVIVPKSSLMPGRKRAPGAHIRILFGLKQYRGGRKPHIDYWQFEDAWHLLAHPTTE
jgi:hypothetical protein